MARSASTYNRYLRRDSFSQIHTNRFTISFWIYKEGDWQDQDSSFEGMAVHVLSIGQGLSDTRYIRIYPDNSIGVLVAGTIELKYRTSANTFANNKWINITLTVDQTTRQLSLYVGDLDGNWDQVLEETFSGTVETGSSSDKITLFTDHRVWTASKTKPSFIGRISDLAFWNRPLSRVESQQLCLNHYAPSLVVPNRLVAYWKLNDGEATETDEILGLTFDVNTGNNYDLGHEPGPALSISTEDLTTVTVYAPNLTSPVGQEVFNKGLVTVEWDIKDPPTSRNNITLNDVTYELEYTENFVGRETNWHVIRRRISGQDPSYDWYVGRMLKSDKVRMRIHSFCELINKCSEYSPSATNFSVNVFKITPPAILSPLPNRAYSDFVTIILGEEQTVNTYNQKVRYKIEYQSEDADVDWTILFDDLPVGSTPLRWNVDALTAADDYQLRLTVTDPDKNQFATVYVRDLKIQHPGLFYIDTKPPGGILEFESKEEITNNLDEIINFYIEDEVTDIKSMALREKNLTSAENTNPLITLGQIDETITFNPVQIQDDCENFTTTKVGYAPKIKWRLTEGIAEENKSGLIKVEAKLTDYGDNDSCQENNHLFLQLWKPDEILTDIITLKETREYLTVSGQDLTVESKPVSTAYVSTTSGRLYRLEPFPTLLYDLGHKISKIKHFLGNLFVFSYLETTDVSRVYRDDKAADLTLITEFTNPLSEIIAITEFSSNLFFGMQNGELWRFDGSAFSQIQTFDNPIQSMYGDDRYLYIGFFSGTHAYLYTGTTFVDLDVEI